MKQFGLLALVLAVVVADIEIRIQSRGSGTTPTFSVTRDNVDDPCNYLRQNFKIDPTIQCVIKKEQTSDYGKMTVVGQSYEGVVIEPALLKVNQNNDGQTIFSGLLYTESPNPKGIFKAAINTIGQDNARFIPYSDAVSRARQALSESLQENGQKPDPVTMIHGKVDHDIVYTADPLHLTHLRASYKVSLRVPSTKQDAIVYIDTHTNEKVWIHKQSKDVQGTTQTNYYGQQAIEVTKVGETYVASQEGPRHLNLNKCDPDFYECFYYAVYDPVTSDNKDEFGTGGDDQDKLTAPYFAAEQVWDFFNDNYGHASWDGNGAEIKIFGMEMRNAFWTVWQGVGETYYGYKTGIDLGSFEVVAHELTHGVIQGTADLVYQYEPGALNEGFADAFGILIYQEALNRHGEWVLGSESPLFQRSISNPKENGNPDTYEGANWYTGEYDNGGVHINSGVFAHAFHMMSAGKEGRNDHRRKYEVQGIGNMKTGKIMYRALNSYLTPYSEYFDARDAMIQAASDLYGQESFEKEQVVEAFKAAGVYRRFKMNNMVVAVLVVAAVGASIAIYQTYFA